MQFVDIPQKRIDVLINQELPDFGDTPCVSGPDLDKRRIALISTGAFHLRSDEIFAPGVSEYRVIPHNADKRDLVCSHPSTNFDRIGFQQDFNVVFPTDRLDELVADGTIESAAEKHYIFSGATIPTEQEEKVRKVSELLHEDNVSGVLLVGL